jgi:dihydrodipicolinate synthase/N-acetylneuraminate lyase
MRRPLTPDDYPLSVVAVPPIALNGDFSFNLDANQAIIRHIERGGVNILLYGGNANLYHFGLDDFRIAVDGIMAAASAETHVIASIGPDFGKAMAQATIARELGVENIMVLPTSFPSDPAGVAEGVRRLADAAGTGLIVYLKREKYMRPEDVARLIKDGAISFVKYAVERADAADDPYLDAIVTAIGTKRIASGMGETPIHDHLHHRGLATYTSGAVCIAPTAANELLSLYKGGRAAEAAKYSAAFLEFEKVRARLGGIQVLHDGLTLSGIANSGPLKPMVSNLPSEYHPVVQAAVDALKGAEADAQARRSAAAA